MSTKPKVKKPAANSIEYAVAARLPSATTTRKGVIVSIDQHFVRFQHPRPHTAKFMERIIPLANVLTITGEVGKAGEIVFFDSGDIVKRTGVMETTSFGFIQVTGLDRNEKRQVTLFNPAYANASAVDLPVPDESTGFVVKKSKKEGEKKSKKDK